MAKFGENHSKITFPQQFPFWLWQKVIYILNSNPDLILIGTICYRHPFYLETNPHYIEVGINFDWRSTFFVVYPSLLLSIGQHYSYSHSFVQTKTQTSLAVSVT